MNWKIIFFTGYFGTWLTIPHLFLQKKRPASTLAWLWAIILFPYFGAAAYLLIATDRMKRKRLRRRSSFERSGLLGPSVREPELPESLGEKRAVLRQLANVNEIPTSLADSIVLQVDAENFYDALVEAIRGARHHVHIEFFTMQPDSVGQRFLQELIAAAERGVEVRLLLDEIGSWSVGTSFFDRLLAAGGKFSWFLTINPLQHRYFIHLRNHRKLQVIDGEVAFVGGMNLGEEYLGMVPALSPWHDMQVRVTGPVVGVLQNSFVDDWYFATEEELTKPVYFPEPKAAPVSHVAQVIAGGPDSPRSPVLKSIIALINSGRERVWITTGYFVPNDLMLTALQIAAARGVDVRLLIAEKNDHPLLVQIGRSFYDELLSFGVRIFEYSKGINHSKILSIDREWISVGSANFDIRSMRLNFELNLLFHSPSRAAEMDAILEHYFEQSEEVLSEKFARRPLRAQLAEAALRPLAPLL